MKVLVLGGTGAMGNHIVDILAKSENSVYVTSRSKKQNKDGVFFIQGNARNFCFLNEILDSNRFDCIIDFMSYKTEEFQERVNLLLDSTDQYVFLSSSRVYASSDKAITEESKRLIEVCRDNQYLETDEYALAKARQEDMLFSCGRKNWTIIRPYITYSNIRMQLGIYEKERWLYRALKGKPIVFSQDIAEKTTTLTYGADVAFVMTRLIGNPRAFGEAFHITMSNSIKWKDVLDIYTNVIERKTGSRPKVIMCEKAIVPGASEYQYKYDRMYNRSFDSSKVMTAIVEKIDFLEVNEGLSRCLTEFIDENHEWREVDWKTEAIFDRISRCHSDLGDIKESNERIKYFVYRYIPQAVTIAKKIKK